VKCSDRKKLIDMTILDQTPKQRISIVRDGLFHDEKKQNDSTHDDSNAQRKSSLRQ